MQRRKRVAFFLAALVGAITSPASAQQPSPDQAKMLAVIANGYRANIESFKVLTCKYNTTFAFAKSLEDALADKWVDKPSISSMACYRNGDRVRYRIEEDEASKRSQDNPKKKFDKFAGLKSGPLVPFMGSDTIISKSHGLLYYPSHRNANIYDGGSRKAKLVGLDFIFNELSVNDIYDLGLLADRAAKGEIGSRVNPANEKGEIEVAFFLSTEQTRTITIDSMRGFLPVRITNLRNGDTARRSLANHVVTEIKECSRGRWFPMRIVRCVKQNPTQSPLPCRTYRVTELDVDKEPPEEAFVLDLPAGTVINQFVDSRKYFKTKKQEHVTVEDLDRIQELTEEVPKKPQVDTAIVQPKRMHWAWYAAGGGLAAVLLALLARRFLRKRGQTHAAT